MIDKDYDGRGHGTKTMEIWLCPAVFHNRCNTNLDPLRGGTHSTPWLSMAMPWLLHPVFQDLHRLVRSLSSRLEGGRGGLRRMLKRCELSSETLVE